MVESKHNIPTFIPSRPEIAATRQLVAFRVTGKDRSDFLQGQLSNDISGLADNCAQLTSYSNPKGRVFAIMRFVRLGDDRWLLLDADIAEKVMQRLKMFVLRSDVQFEQDDDFGSVVVAGKGATDHPADNKLARLVMPGAMPRVELFGPRNTLPVATASAADLRRWDTLSGLLQITPEHCEQHVAQMLNLDRLGAIHFKKGCYAGQEIIARMHYLGKLKQRALPCVAASGAVGDAIHADGKKAGEILQTSDIPGDGNHGKLHLAMLKLAAIESELTLENGDKVTLLDTGLGNVEKSTDAS